MQKYYFLGVCPFVCNDFYMGILAMNKLSLTENEVLKKSRFLFVFGKSYTIYLILQRPIIALLRGE
jgi:hypothetical protein